jgi:hypothetical protein
VRRRLLALGKEQAQCGPITTVLLTGVAARKADGVSAGSNSDISESAAQLAVPSTEGDTQVDVVSVGIPWYLIFSGYLGRIQGLTTFLICTSQDPSSVRSISRSLSRILWLAEVTALCFGHFMLQCGPFQSTVRPFPRG